MVKRRKVMNAAEMEQWLLDKGAVPVTDEIMEKSWFREVSSLPPCMFEEKVGETRKNTLVVPDTQP